MGLDEKLDDLERNFSNNQKRLFKRIEPITNRRVAISLISLQGVGNTSQSEIEVISNLISQFNPLNILSFQESPQQISFSGRFSKGHIVHIEPQYKIENRNPKAQPWAIDLVLKLYRKIGQDMVEIAVIGVEYDGHISHYVESKIKGTYKRDAAIISDKGIQSLRISPELWRGDAEDLKKAIKKYFEHQIRKIEKVQLSTLNAQVLISSISKFQTEDLSTTTCPICNGRCYLAREECPACKGMGSIKKHVAKAINLSDYDNLTCPDCRGITLDCDTCKGLGTISREKALELL